MSDDKSKRTIKRPNIGELPKASSDALDRVNTALASSRRLHESLSVSSSIAQQVQQALRSDVIWQMQEMTKKYADIQSSFKVPDFRIDIPSNFQLEDYFRSTRIPMEEAAQSLRKTLDSLHVDLQRWQPLVEHLRQQIEATTPVWVEVSSLQLDRARKIAEAWPENLAGFSRSNVIDSTFGLTEGLVNIYADPLASHIDTESLHLAIGLNVDAMEGLSSPEALPSADGYEPFGMINLEKLSEPERATVAEIWHLLSNPGPGRLRHLASSLRKLHNSILLRLAPNATVLNHITDSVPERLHKRLLRPAGAPTEPTWNGRVFYILRQQPLSVKEFMLRAEFNAAQIHNNLSKLDHGDPVQDDQGTARVMIMQLENLLQILLDELDD